jgi:DNA-binding transcriptional LysR family regulator
MARINFDLDVMRTFATGIELGSFARAADRLGRSTSAVSAQLKKLEEQAGTPLLRKEGRGLALTAAGETMLAYARRLLDLNDEAVAAIHEVEIEGWVRLGLQEDFAETFLPTVLGRFARAHPKIRIEARVARNSELIERVIAGRLDLALAWGDGSAGPYAERLAEIPMRWIASANQEPIWRLSDGEPMPLAALEAPCVVRNLATKALDKAGVAWRLAFETPSLGGLWAATAAGLGLTARTEIGLPTSVRALQLGEKGLPPLPALSLSLHRAEASPGPAAARLGAIIIEEVRHTIPQGRKAA